MKATADERSLNFAVFRRQWRRPSVSEIFSNVTLNNIQSIIISFIQKPRLNAKYLVYTSIYMYTNIINQTWQYLMPSYCLKSFVSVGKEGGGYNITKTRSLVFAECRQNSWADQKVFVFIPFSITSLIRTGCRVNYVAYRHFAFHFPSFMYVDV